MRNEKKLEIADSESSFKDFHSKKKEKMGFQLKMKMHLDKVCHFCLRCERVYLDP